MLNSFGKYTRILRLEKGEVLRDMAQKLNVTSSYLSAVELGKRPIPNNWKAEIIEIYDLNEEQQKKLSEAIDKSIYEIKIDLKEKSDEDRDLILSFARKFDNLDEQTKVNLKEYFSKK